MQCSIFASDLVQLGDIVLNISRGVPISLLKLVFLGIQVFFPVRDRHVFRKLETAVNTVRRRQGSGQKSADQKSRASAGLEKNRQNIRGISKKIAPEVVLHIGRAELGKVLGKFS